MGSPDDAGMSEAGSGDAGLLRDIENAERIAEKRGVPVLKLGQGDTARSFSDAGGGVLREDEIDPMLAELRKITQCFEEAAANIRAIRKAIEGGE